MEDIRTQNLKGTTQKIARGDSEYPARLNKLPDPPPYLYVQGRVPTMPTVAIVGSRNADATAKRFVSRISGEISERGLAVLSGGAEGIDTAAHEGALEAGGITVAVIGSGFDFMYPISNKALFLRIAEQGALITEFDPPQPPAKWTFPKRNRLVAAMAQAVIVAQAKERSGALITARIAREIGVPVGSVPGLAGDPKYHGGHQLLRLGAGLVENVADVLALIDSPAGLHQLELPVITDKKIARTINSALTPAMSKILDFLNLSPVHIDHIIAQTKLASGEVNAALMSLEIAGLVEDEGGKNYVKVI